ncbi:hypothetical protein BT67DRAFT_437337 [Trichocladium antarcticum]|uniref:Pyridoxamine 5'-phosphate oxidase Alr4036 family FMN-binding domain-containing protein n=1 Tax=Trichocladium antarcticum TaxID=1450529 RepID=A0AAN6UBL6_9PEZI|nr:hypothetical protein BT67DRAFT_437337 [Trichocladium antarcticum]
MPPPAAAAPWRAPFLSHLATLNPPVFALATLHHPSTSTSAQTPTPPPLPRARTCVCRGLWASLPANPHNRAPRNPPVYESDLPVFTTDARSEKVVAGLLGGLEGREGLGGGGGPVEACFWMAAVQTQWRVRGRAWVLAGVEEAEGDGEGVAAAPGPPRVAGPGEEGGEGLLGRRVDDLGDPEARRNFRVVVIVPDEVDQVDLSDELRPRRWLYVYRGDGAASELPGGEVIGEWEKVEVWP